MDLARPYLDHAVRKRGTCCQVPGIFRVSFKYLSSIRGRGAARSSELMHKVGCLRCFVSHSYTIASAQKGILFRECGICPHFGHERSCQSESTAVWSFHPYEKGEKAPSGPARLGEFGSQS